MFRTALSIRAKLNEFNDSYASQQIIEADIYSSKIKMKAACHHCVPVINSSPRDSVKRDTHAWSTLCRGWSPFARATTTIRRSYIGKYLHTTRLSPAYGDVIFRCVDTLTRKKNMHIGERMCPAKNLERFGNSLFY